MNRKVFFKKSGLPALLTTLTAIPYYAFADTNSIFQPIIPQSGGCLCIGGAPDWGCVLQVIQNIINVGVALGVVFVVLSIAYGGFLFMVNSTNPENIQKGRQVMLNAVIGLVVVLSAWLVVDFIMKILYEPSTAFEGGTFGPWNSILASNGKDYCIEPKDPVPLTTGTVEILTGDAPGGNSPVVSGGGPVSVSANGRGACNAKLVQAAAVSGGINMSAREANTIACIAGPESGCGTQMQNYNWNGAKSTPPSTAYGPFQITLKGNSTCLNNTACQKAAGVTGSLDCSKAFDRKGYAIPGTLLNQCRTAAANLSCSAVAASCIVAANKGSYSAWTGNKDSTAKHQACVANYSNI